jgi:hypothetical protein
MWPPSRLDPAATRRFDQGLSCSSEMSLFVWSGIKAAATMLTIAQNRI